MKNLLLGYRFTAFLTTVTDSSLPLRMTFNVLCHYDAFTVSRHSERGQECLVRKTENGTVTQSEESITLVTAYRFPHHDNRSFAAAQDDALPPLSPRQQIL